VSTAGETAICNTLINGPLLTADNTPSTMFGEQLKQAGVRGSPVQKTAARTPPSIASSAGLCLGNHAASNSAV